MWRWVGLAVVLACSGGAAVACPALANKDKHQYFSARELARPKVSEVRAGGTVLLDHCAALPGAGNIPFDPSVSIYFTAGRSPRDLEFRTEGGGCDTVLLVRSPSGRWFFDDDNGAGRNARLRLGAAREGRYEIWVGSREGRACASRLALQSFRSSLRLAGL